jgi:hypothetical protein
MSVSLRAAASFFASSATPSVTIPASTQGGDIMYIVTAGAWLPSSTAPSGWTVSTGPFGVYWQWIIYRKVAAGIYGTLSSDAGTTVSLSYSGVSDVQSSIIVADTQGASINPFMTSLYDTAVTAGTLNPTVRKGELIAYVSSIRTNTANTINLSRGTTVATRSADTNSGSVLGYELVTTSAAISQVFTPSATGTGNRGRMFVALQFTQPLSDTFTSAGEIRSGAAITNLDTTSWTTEAGEPGSLDKTGWATVTPSASARYAISTIGSNYDTVINLYTGTTINGLTLIASDDESGGSGSSLLQAQLIAGTTYYIQVGTKSGGSGGLLTFQVDQLSTVQLTSTHAELITDGAGQTGGRPATRLTSTHVEIVTDAAGNTGGLSRTLLTSIHIEVLTPAKRVYIGWGIPL